MSDICYGGDGIRVKETWKFTVSPNDIVWQIDRDYLSGGTLDDTLFPGWNFQDMNTWTGGMLNHGGVAWNKYLETHKRILRHACGFGHVLEARNQRLPADLERGCRKLGAPVRYSPPAVSGSPQVALRFSRQPSGTHTVAFSVTPAELRPRHNLRRFHPSRQDLWAPFQVQPGRTSVRYTLQALDYEETTHPGTFAGLNGSSIRELLNTIGRYGVIDRRIVGANGWRTGFTCLHEQWFSQMGIAINDPDYLANCAATFDQERDHAIEASGRVKSRWCYDAGDAMPGSYDAHGYYEAQWGYLLDSQPCFAICVA